MTPSTKARLRYVLLYVMISCSVIVLTLIAAFNPTITPFFMDIVFVAPITIFLFGTLIKQSNGDRRKPAFWPCVAILMVLHVSLCLLVIKLATSGKLFWIGCITVAEYPLYGAALNRAFAKQRRQ